MLDSLSEDFKFAWLKTLLILLPLFIIGFGFGGFYHESLGESGWSLKGTIEFGQLIVHSVFGNVVFWGLMLGIGRLLAAVWSIF